MAWRPEIQSSSRLSQQLQRGSGATAAGGKILRFLQLLLLLLLLQAAYKTAVTTKAAPKQYLRK